MGHNNSISADTIGECWMSCIETIMNHGSIHYDEDVEIKEILGLTVNIAHPEMDDKIINEFGDSTIVQHTLDKFSKGACMPDRPFTYGAYIYNYSGVNQFEWMVERLQAKRETKSATFSLLTPGSKSANLPCLTTVDAKIRDNKLELQFFFRSQNIFGRQYANLLALVKIQSDIAERCSVEIGSLRGYIASAHIYEYDFSQAELIISGKKVTIVDKYYSDGPKSIRK